MSHPDDVFAAFIRANPAPEAAVRDAVRPSAQRFLSSLEREGIEMTDIKPVRDDSVETNPDPSEPTTRRANRWHRPWIAATAALLVVLVLGGFWFAWSSRSDDPEPAAPNLAQDIELEALATAELWLASLNTGDVETILDIVRPDQADVANQRMYEYHAVFAASGTPSTEVQSCAVASTTASLVTVDCAVVLGDPVAEAVGASEVIFPFWYVEGLLSWRPAQGGDLGLLNRAYSEYLSLFYPTEYAAACSPAAYEPDSVLQDKGVALTPECAVLQVPLSSDVAQWIRDGKPQP